MIIIARKWENLGTKIEDMATATIISDKTPIFAGFFSCFFRDHPNFQGISGTFSGVSTILGFFQGFQGFQGSLTTLFVMSSI